ncbi:MAG: SigF/SigG family RNA polymerase sporulation sigma factor [Lachnospiraceae bacterium]|nr:SigF/SigG family RNA polymerase sporulation sigma factor [Lachnospiraceae bacterium]
MEEVSVLIAKSQQGDKGAREVLIENNLGLVHAIVHRFIGRGVEPEDLFQIGSIGLMKAIDNFDLNYNVKFSTYAVPLITGEIKRFLRDDGIIKVSRGLKEQSLKVNLIHRKLQGILGREPTLEEISAESGLTLEEIVLATEADCKVESIYASVYQNDGSEVALVDMLGKEDEEKEALINHMLLQQLLEGLNESESLLIRMRYFQDKTQMEVARHMGISQVQVSRLEKKILLSMRKKAEGKVC